jgi:hypothetical protein
VEGADFKHSLATRGYSPRLRTWYASLHLAKYVWLYEVTMVPGASLEHWNGVSSKHRKIHGEFLYDATTPDYDVHLLAERFLTAYPDEDSPHRRRDDPEAGLYDCFPGEGGVGDA